MDHKKLKELVKPLLRSVLLKVHPDFFAAEPTAKKLNQVSVQRLQLLMSPVLRDNNHKNNTNRKYQGRVSTAEKNEMATPLEFMFHSDNALRKVSVSFRSHGQVRAAAQVCAQRIRCLVNLCEQLKITPTQNTIKGIEAALGNMNGAGYSTNPNGRFLEFFGDAQDQLRAARVREARRNYQNNDKASDINKEFHQRLRNASWMPGNTANKSAELRLDRSKVFFSSDVDPKVYCKVVQVLEESLIKLEYTRWCMLPLMIVSNWKCAFKGRDNETKYPGFVVMPVNVLAQEFVRYLDSNIDEVKKRRLDLNSQWLNNEVK